MLAPPPPDADRLPMAVNRTLQSAFDAPVDRFPASDAGFVGLGRVTAPELEVLAQSDGTFQMAFPIAAHEDAVGSVDSIAEGVRNVLDGPVLMDALGANVAWTARVFDPQTERAYIVQQGVAGTRMDEEDRPPNLWSDSLYETAVTTYAAMLVTGNHDTRGPNLVVNRDAELVCVDFDAASILDYANYTTGKAGIPDSLWDTVCTRMVELSRQILDTGLPSAITPARRDIVRVNARRILTSPHY